MKKSILIFGGGINQLTLINAAKELGVKSIVLDPNCDAPGKETADFFYCFPGNDYDKTREIAIKHSVSGVVTSQMEKPMRLMAKLAQEFGFNFHTPEVTEKSLDKWLMKQAFLENNVPCAKGKLFYNIKNISKNSLEYLKFPLIIKPKDATSSQGVYRINEYFEIEKYFQITSSFSKTNEVIIEEFLDGPEFSIETITFNGKTTVVQYTEKFVTPFPRTVEMGHIQPATLTENEKREIDNVVIAAINAIGIDNSASHIEVKLTKEGPKIIEIGARLGGDYISSYLVKYSCGIDMDLAAIQVALGENPHIKTKNYQFTYIKYFELPIGMKVESVDDWHFIYEDNSVLFANIAVKPGDIIQEITDSAKRPGFVIVQGKSREEVINLGNKYSDKLNNKIKLI